MNQGYSHNRRVLDLARRAARRAISRRAVGVALGLGLAVGSGSLAAQTVGKVSFEQDVMPLLRESCVDCHGPTKQKGGLRLDRRSSALKPFTRRVVAGNSANSMVYQRVAGNEFGSQMPPTAALRPEKISLIKRWIEQGAEWPTALSNEVDLPPSDPRAVTLVEALSEGDLKQFMSAVEAEPGLLNARGPEGSTPFMYAVVYLEPDTLARLLKLGADPNRANDAHGTALMWAARDLAKTRLLVRHGADVNARSDNRRTPLMIAARRPGARAVVKFLLDHGADPNPNTNPTGESSPLLEALTGGDQEIIDLLIRRGANVKATGEWGLTMALVSGCGKAFESLAAQITDRDVYTMALSFSAVLGDAKAFRVMLDKGADVNAADPTGRTPLMYAAISDLMPTEAIELMIQRGADVNARSTHARTGDAGLSVLDIARLNGETPVVRLLERHGARGSTNASVTRTRPASNDVRNAVERSLPLLQRADAGFAKGAGCASCHDNSMESMAYGLAAKRGFRIDTAGAQAHVAFNGEQLTASRDRLHEGYYVTPVGDMFSDFTLGYQLVGLHAQGRQPDMNTDAAVMLLRSRQKPNGEWAYPKADTRPPIGVDHVSQTALSMRGLQLYAPRLQKAEYARAVRRAADWLARVQVEGHENRAWRVTGLAWAGNQPEALRTAVKELLATQRADGGWSDLPTTASTAYATGLGLVALHTAGLPVTDPAYQRGVRYLLETQEEDGSWHIRTRALGFQPYFDAGFPHDHDQWISAAATSWATMALVLTVPETARANGRTTAQGLVVKGE